MYWRGTDRLPHIVHHLDHTQPAMLDRTEIAMLPWDCLIEKFPNVVTKMMQYKMLLNGKSVQSRFSSPKKLKNQINIDKELRFVC